MKNVGLMFYCFNDQVRYLLNFYEGYESNVSTIYCQAILIQHKSSLLDLYLIEKEWRNVFPYI